MDKEKFSRMTNIYQFIVLAAFIIYAYNVQENWRIDVSKEKFKLVAFIILLLFGGALSAIELKAETNKGKTISKNTIYWGIVFALAFLFWRLAIGLF